MLEFKDKCVITADLSKSSRNLDFAWQKQNIQNLVYSIPYNEIVEMY